MTDRGNILHDEIAVILDPATALKRVERSRYEKQDRDIVSAGMRESYRDFGGHIMELGKVWTGSRLSLI